MESFIARKEKKEGVLRALFKHVLKVYIFSGSKVFLFLFQIQSSLFDYRERLLVIVALENVYKYINRIRRLGPMVDNPVVGYL